TRRAGGPPCRPEAAGAWPGQNRGASGRRPASSAPWPCSIRRPLGSALGGAGGRRPPRPSSPPPRLRALPSIRPRCRGRGRAPGLGWSPPKVARPSAPPAPRRGDHRHREEDVERELRRPTFAPSAVVAGLGAGGRDPIAEGTGALAVPGASGPGDLLGQAIAV